MIIRHWTWEVSLSPVRGGGGVRETIKKGLLVGGRLAVLTDEALMTINYPKWAKEADPHRDYSSFKRFGLPVINWLEPGSYSIAGEAGSETADFVVEPIPVDGDMIVGTVDLRSDDDVGAGGNSDPMKAFDTKVNGILQQALKQQDLYECFDYDPTTVSTNPQLKDWYGKVMALPEEEQRRTLEDGPTEQDYILPTPSKVAALTAETSDHFVGNAMHALANFATGKKDKTRLQNAAETCTAERPDDVFVKSKIEYIKHYEEKPGAMNIFRKAKYHASIEVTETFERKDKPGEFYDQVTSHQITIEKGESFAQFLVVGKSSHSKKNTTVLIGDDFKNVRADKVGEIAMGLINSWKTYSVLNQNCQIHAVKVMELLSKDPELAAEDRKKISRGVMSLKMFNMGIAEKVVQIMGAVASKPARTQSAY